MKTTKPKKVNTVAAPVEDVRGLDVAIGRVKGREAKLEAACQAVLLFHRAGRWDSPDYERWFELTGSPNRSLPVLCGFVQEALHWVGESTAFNIYPRR